MLKKFLEGGKEELIPEIFKGIQVNCCNNPTCINYGVDPHNNTIKKKRKSSSSVYKVKGFGKGSGKSSPVLYCDQCHARVPIKSNKSLFDEFTRLNTTGSIQNVTLPVAFSIVLLIVFS